MNTEDVKTLIESEESVLLLDVLPSEVHKARCLPGAVNACVYEMSFLETVEGLAPSKDTRIVVFGAGEGSLDSKVARDKLLASGYTRVDDYSGGVSAWEEAGNLLGGDRVLPSAPQMDGRYVVDVEQSLIRWTGRNLFNHHDGTVRLASGEVRFRSDKLEAAVFEVDMESIACEDITDLGANAMLIRHLRDADFFEVDRFPTARFVAEELVAVDGVAEGIPNYWVKGSFTLRGVTRPLEFPLVIAADDAGRLTGQAQIELDRTEFGSIYGSGKFFRFLGMHVVNDHVQLHLKIHAERAK